MLMLVAFSPALLADDYIVDVDRKLDFSAIRTFAIRGAFVRINRPELNNQVVIDGTTTYIRSALSAKGLKEVADNPDVLLDWKSPVRDLPSMNGAGPLPRKCGRVKASGARSTRRCGGLLHRRVLVLDMTARSSGLLIWRGVYQDNEMNSGKLARDLPGQHQQVAGAIQAGEEMSGPCRMWVLGATCAVLMPVMASAAEGASSDL